jgi:hypothetical protein
VRSRSTWPARTKASTRARSSLGGLTGACGVVALCERISDGKARARLAPSAEVAPTERKPLRETCDSFMVVPFDRKREVREKLDGGGDEYGSGRREQREDQES